MRPLRLSPIFIAATTAAIYVSPAAGGAGISPPKPYAIAMSAEIVVVGKVKDLERDEVEAFPPGLHPIDHRKEPRPRKLRYRVADLSIEEPLIGARGLTRMRVGFLVIDPAAKPRGPAPLDLKPGQEGCFFLIRHDAADFYILQSGFGIVPLLKTNPNYDQELSRVKLVAKAIDDPITALKAKEAADRHLAAQAVLTHYSRINLNPAGGGPKMEEFPAEQNKLLLDVLLELPWTPKGGPLSGELSRSALWNYVRADQYGFQPPAVARVGRGQPQPDLNKAWDEATTKFLKENVDKIKLQRVVPPK
jgi:hypothetical protein